MPNYTKMMQGTDAEKYRRGSKDKAAEVENPESLLFKFFRKTEGYFICGCTATTVNPSMSMASAPNMSDATC